MSCSHYTWRDSAESSYTDHLPAGSDLMSEAKRVLVLGCGTAKGFLAFAAMFPNTEFVLVDMNADYIAEVAENAPENVTAVNRSFSLFYDDMLNNKQQETFDFVHCFGVLGYLNDQDTKMVFDLINLATAHDALVLVSYDNALFCYPWVQLRKTAIELCNLYGRAIGAEELIPMLKALYQNDCAFKTVLHEIEVKPSLLCHSVFQPFYEPLFHSEVAKKMKERSFEQVDLPGYPKEGMYQQANKPSPQEHRIEIWRKNIF